MDFLKLAPLEEDETQREKEKIEDTSSEEEEDDEEEKVGTSAKKPASPVSARMGFITSSQESS